MNATKVWVLTYWDYDGESLEGIYSTPDAALAQYPDKVWVKNRYGGGWNCGVAMGYNIEPWDVLDEPEI